MHAGDQVANHVAAFAPVTASWSALGPGLAGPEYAAAVMPNGDLVVGGRVATTGGAAEWHARRRW